MFSFGCGKACNRPLICCDVFVRIAMRLNNSTIPATDLLIKVPCGRASGTHVPFAGTAPTA